jgi:putative hemolysin
MNTSDRLNSAMASTPKNSVPTTGLTSWFSRQKPVNPLIDLRFEPVGRFQRVARRVLPVATKLLSIDHLNRIYDQQIKGSSTPQECIRRVFDALRVHWRVSPQDLQRIPRTGPLIVVANHPTGGMEGLALASLLLSVRPDAKLMVNFLLGKIPELRDLFFFVDPFGGEAAKAASGKGMRESIRHLKSGGVLGVFPAGEVASFNLKNRRVVESPWNESVARLARMTGATVLPVYFDGKTSVAFNALGLIHERVRTAMLGREIVNQTGKKLGVRIGSPIPPRRLAEFPTDQAMIEFLRQRTFNLKHRPVRKLAATKSRFKTVPLAIRRKLVGEKPPQPIIDAVPTKLLIDDINRLPEEQKLVTGEAYDVFYARSHQIPAVLREIGRLREITFRATDEGTGKPLDLDSFDDYYLHLFMWDRAKQRIVGGYRMGQTDTILAERGVAGLYTSTLFVFDSRLIKRISPALEMGRSFVCQEYQKSYQPLLMLWKGISAYMVRHPHYRYLTGPVSISNEYQTISKTLMVEFLKAMKTPRELAHLVTARRPFFGKLPRGVDPKTQSSYIDHDDLSDAVADIEPDQKGMPILLRHYLKLGAKLLAFNVDPDFGNCVDGLIVVDLADPKAPVERYFGKEGRKSYLEYHAKLKTAAAM